MKCTDLNRPVLTLEKAIEDIQKVITVLDGNIKSYVGKNQNLDSDLIEILNTSHLAWMKLDELNDWLFNQRCEQGKRKPVRKVEPRQVTTLRTGKAQNKLEKV